MQSTHPGYIPGTSQALREVMAHAMQKSYSSIERTVCVMSHGANSYAAETH